MAAAASPSRRTWSASSRASAGCSSFGSASSIRGIGSITRTRWSGFRADLYRDSGDCDEQLLELRVVLSGGRRLLARLQLFELCLELGAALHEHRHRGIGWERKRGVRFKVGHPRYSFVGARVQRIAADAGASVV